MIYLIQHTPNEHIHSTGFCSKKRYLTFSFRGSDSEPLNRTQEVLQKTILSLAEKGKEFSKKQRNSMNPKLETEKEFSFK